MTAALIVVFVLAYTAIALEEPLRINKSGAALIGAGLLWTIYALSMGRPELVDEELAHSLIETAQIVFFLIGAMTVVEVVDSHDGFEVITSRIKAKSLGAFVWIIGTVTFFLSAMLDNLTTTIVMVSLCRKLLSERRDRLLMAGVIVISANAGGAWSPIGDVTTTMLWIGGQVTTIPIITGVIIPSLVNMIVPLSIVSYGLRGRAFAAAAATGNPTGRVTTLFERNLMFCMGLAALVSVPIFKAVTHLPPFMGILLGLGILWAVGDLVHRNKPYEEREHVTIANALTRIDMSAIVFFIGILLAVATLSHAGILAALAEWLDDTVGRLDVIVMSIGLVSAIVDNVPMVAAAMGMYSMDAHPPDSFLWEFMAYCAGTGGSILIIGSAAGVAAMGIEKIDFIWYMKRFSLLALSGYVAGALVYIAQYSLLH
ncbi:MAG: sodium:proton antiporter NhaD [Novosphingobium sp.]|nr:sodium:proton antiporter NhaD [Novosphingobium sp.]MCB2077215.1 sodium:proton antiporter NhaD [Novosphingobium sp.]